MHLTGIKLGGIPPFTEPIALRFDRRVNVFIGPNASGKSTLLNVIDTDTRLDGEVVVGMDSELEFQQELNDEEFEVGSDFNIAELAVNLLMKLGDRILFALDEEDPVDPWCLDYNDDVANPVVWVGPFREALPDIDQVAKRAEQEGSSHSNMTNSFSASRTMSLYDELLDELKLGHPFGLRVGLKVQVLTDAMRHSDSCARQICGELMRDSDPHNYIHGPDPQEYLADPAADPSRITLLRLQGINTNDIRSSGDGLRGFMANREGMDSMPIYLGNTSSGTHTTLLWIRWLALKMVHHYEFEEDWYKKPAILLIDEIENHLHPTWQRRVIPALLEHFPKLQIFATTHSPFVVAGLKAGQVHILNRDANGLVTASSNERDVVGWTADEILRGMMGVMDPTDDATAAAAEELRRLRNAGPQPDERDEEERQRRIEELRGKVDRDLLAGGPMAAQRELFERHFAEALENHRREQSLQQEND